MEERDKYFNSLAHKFRAHHENADQIYDELLEYVQSIIDYEVRRSVLKCRLPGYDADELEQLCRIELWTMADRYRYNDSKFTHFYHYARAGIQNTVRTQYNKAFSAQKNLALNKSLSIDLPLTDDEKCGLRDTIGEADPENASDIREVRDLFWKEVDRYHPLTDIEKFVLQCRRAGMRVIDIRNKYNMTLRKIDNATQRLKRKAEQYLLDDPSRSWDELL